MMRTLNGHRLFLGLVLIVTGLAHAERPIMTMMTDDEQPGHQRLIWSTDPGIRYELQESSDLSDPDSWTTVAGYPTEAEALAQQALIVLDAPDRKFYRVATLDEQPPEIVSRTPVDGAFGVGRFSPISFMLDDVTGVDSSSISFTVAEHGMFTTGSPQLSYEDGVVTFWLGGDDALGGYGDSIEVELIVADGAGNVATNVWSFTLEIEPVLDGDVFVFGSPEAQRAGQKLTDSQRAIANRTVGGTPMPMTDPQNPWTLEEVGDNHILISYQGSTPPSFSVDQRLVNAAPVREHEVFYRKVTGVQVNAGEQTVLLDTVNVAWWEIAAEVSQLFTPATTIQTIYEILEDGLLVDAGVSIEIGATFGQTFEFSEGGTTAAFQLDGSFSFVPELHVAFNIHDKQLEALYVKVAGTLTADAEFVASVSGSLERSYTPSVPFFRNDYMSFLGMAGPIPVWVNIRFSLNAEVGVNLAAASEARYDFYYQRYRSFAATYSPRAPELNGWKTENFSVLGAGDSKPEFTTDISGGVWAELIPEIDVRLMHVAGAKAAIPAGVALNANASFSGGELADYNWAITAYIDVRGDVSVFAVQDDILPFSYRFFERQWAGPPTPHIHILAHPQSQSVTAGQTVVLSASATGPGALLYQWYRNGSLYQHGGNQLVINNAHSGHTGDYHVVARSGGQAAVSDTATVTVTADSGPAGDYLVIDLSAGPSASSYPVSYLSAIPPGGWTDEYKTTKLVLRRIPAGTFTMGSPAGEQGRYSVEAQRQVTLTKDFYIGVFQVTQKQWERVMGYWPSYFNNVTYRDSRPLEQRSWNDIRGGTWPGGQAASGTFMQRISDRTGLSFDLPTEAQWEYACRAGTTTALNSGKNLTNTGSCPNMSEVGRYWFNGGSGFSQGGSTAVGTAKVGSYVPNAWGLYDMHGNVWEWCLDWYAASPQGTIDPVGAASGSNRVRRGGGCYSNARYCRSATRRSVTPSDRKSVV